MDRASQTAPSLDIKSQVLVQTTLEKVVVKTKQAAWTRAITCTTLTRLKRLAVVSIEGKLLTVAQRKGNEIMIQTTTSMFQVRTCVQVLRRPFLLHWLLPLPPHILSPPRNLVEGWTLAS